LIMKVLRLARTRAAASANGMIVAMASGHFVFRWIRSLSRTTIRDQNIRPVLSPVEGRLRLSGRSSPSDHLISDPLFPEVRR
jgi:hypothetical protein